MNRTDKRILIDAGVVNTAPNHAVHSAAIYRTALSRRRGDVCFWGNKWRVRGQNSLSFISNANRQTWFAVAAIGLTVAGILFFRHHEKELEQRAEAAFPGPWLHRDF